MNAMHTSVFSLFLASHPGMLHPDIGRAGWRRGKGFMLEAELEAVARGYA
jgi:hypothetical protein